MFFSINTFLLLCHKPITTEPADRHNYQPADKINLNNADWPSIARLPGIGYQRAISIIQYRRQLQNAENNNRVFNNISNLQNIKGIGPATVDKISPYLKFEK